jgi:hypothetical protein
MFGARTLGLLATALALGGCSSATTARPCSGATGCKSGQACVMGRCGGEDAPSGLTPAQRRLSLGAEAMWIVGGDRDDGAPSGAMFLGGDARTATRVFLRFPRQSYPRNDVVRAYLVLERAEAASVGPDDVLVSTARLLEPWSRRPDVAPNANSQPMSESLAESWVRAAGRGPIRLDVTAYARELSADAAASRAPTYGLRLEGRGAGRGIAIGTGYGSAPGPRLEVYLQ